MVPKKRIEDRIEEVKKESLALAADIVNSIPEIPEEALDAVASDVDTLLRENGKDREKKT